MALRVSTTLEINGANAMNKTARTFLLVGALMAASYAGVAHAATSADQTALSTAARVPEPPLVGSGTFRWYGLRLYEIEYRETPDACTPRMLRITYARRVPADRLVEATLEQWREIGLNDDPSLRGWLRQIRTIWPDIEPGDVLMLQVDQDGVSHFFGTEGYLGTIPDPAFGNAFIAIWLSPDTTEPTLRKQLLAGGSSCPVFSF